MGAGRHDHLGLGDAALLAAALACGLHRAEDALRAAGGHEAGDVVVAVEQVGGDAHDVALDATEARERLGVQGVVVEEHPGDGLHHRVGLGTGVVDHAEGLAVLPAHIAGAHLGQRLDDLGLVPACLRQRHSREVKRAVGSTPWGSTLVCGRQPFDPPRPAPARPPTPDRVRCHHERLGRGRGSGTPADVGVHAGVPRTARRHALRRVDGAGGGGLRRGPRRGAGLHGRVVHRHRRRGDARRPVRVLLVTLRHQRRLRAVNQELADNQARSHALQEVTGRLARALTSEDVVSALLDHLPATVGAKTAAVAIVSDAGPSSCSSASTTASLTPLGSRRRAR